MRCQRALIRKPGCRNRKPRHSQRPLQPESHRHSRRHARPYLDRHVPRTEQEQRARLPPVLLHRRLAGTARQPNYPPAARLEEPLLGGHRERRVPIHRQGQFPHHPHRGRQQEREADSGRPQRAHLLQHRLPALRLPPPGRKDYLRAARNQPRKYLLRTMSHRPRQQPLGNDLHRALQLRPIYPTAERVCRPQRLSLLLVPAQQRAVDNRQPHPQHLRHPHAQLQAAAAAYRPEHHTVQRRHRLHTPLRQQRPAAEHRQTRHVLLQPGHRQRDPPGRERIPLRDAPVPNQPDVHRLAAEPVDRLRGPGVHRVLPLQGAVQQRQLPALRAEQQVRGVAKRRQGPQAVDFHPDGRHLRI